MIWRIIVLSVWVTWLCPAWAGIKSGTGFLISSDGYLLTSHHVVDGAKGLLIKDATGRIFPARIVESDYVNDLSLLKIEDAHGHLPLGSMNSAPKGGKVITVGFPHVDIQGGESKVTEGLISSHTGIQGDTRFYQTTTPIQSGNSGGPLVSMDGQVVGIVVSKLSAVKMYKETGDLPQNVNFAIKSEMAYGLVHNNVSPERLQKSRFSSFKNIAQLTKSVERAVVLIYASDRYRSETFEDAGAPLLKPLIQQWVSPEILRKQGEQAIKDGDRVLGLNKIQRAAKLGDASAQYNLALMYHIGASGLRKNESKARYWYLKSANQGDSFAQFSVGNMYFNGLSGFVKNEVKAVSWIRKSAEQGNFLSQYSLAHMYLNGSGGLIRDDVEVARLLLSSAKQGHAPAQSDIGVMYMNGAGGLKQDDVEAANWFRVSAEQGHAAAQHYIAYLYEHGRGVPQDTAAAVNWYGRAAEQGYEYSRKALTRLGRP